jgi:hypothetical protein
VLATRRHVADRNRDTANRTPDFTNMELLEVCTMLLKPMLFNRYAERHLLVRDVGCQSILHNTVLEILVALLKLFGFI